MGFADAHAKRKKTGRAAASQKNTDPIPLGAFKTFIPSPKAQRVIGRVPKDSLLHLSVWSVPRLLESQIAIRLLAMGPKGRAQNQMLGNIAEKSLNLVFHQRTMSGNGDDTLRMLGYLGQAIHVDRPKGWVHMVPTPRYVDASGNRMPGFTVYFQDRGVALQMAYGAALEALPETSGPKAEELPDRTDM